MYRFSNTLIGILNLLTLLASIPIIGGGLWLARHSAACESFFQTPLLVIGFAVLLVSLAGFVGACFRVAWALWLYILAMLLVILALLAFTAFGFAVTGLPTSSPGPSDGHPLHAYSPWLRSRVEDPLYWETVTRCLSGSRTCAGGPVRAPSAYLQRDASPVKAGCCEPPAECNMTGGGGDCSRWRGTPEGLCYGCDSCRAAVLEAVRRDWRMVAVLDIVMLLLLVGVLAVACCAFRNSRRLETGNPYGENRMTKIRPSWTVNCWRRWYEWKEGPY